MRIKLTDKIYLVDEQTSISMADNDVFRVCIMYDTAMMSTFPVLTAPDVTTSAVHVFKIHKDRAEADMDSNVYALLKMRDSKLVLIDNRDMGILTAVYILMALGYTLKSARQLITGATEQQLPTILGNYIADYDKIKLMKIVTNIPASQTTSSNAIVLCTPPALPSITNIYPNSMVYTFGGLATEHKAMLTGLVHTVFTMPHDELLADELESAYVRLSAVAERILAHGRSQNKTVILCDYFTWQRAAAVAAKLLCDIAMGGELKNMPKAIDYVDKLFLDDFCVTQADAMLYGDKLTHDAVIASKASALNRKGLCRLLTRTPIMQDACLHRARIVEI